MSTTSGPPDLVIESWGVLGRAYGGVGMMEEGVEALGRSLEFLPHDVEGLSAMGKCLMVGFNACWYVDWFMNGLLSHVVSVPAHLT